MGYDAYAYTVLGCRVKEKNLYRTKKIRGCKHPIKPIEGQNYCPTCGQPLYEDREQRIVPHTGEELDGLDVVEQSSEGGDVVIGLVFARTGSSNGGDKMAGFSLQDFSAYKERIKKVLEKYGLWDESMFYFWTILYESC